MSLVTFISTLTFIVIVHTFFYRKLLLVKKYKAHGKFAKFGYKDQVHIDWNAAVDDREFTAEWRRVMPKYYVLFALGIMQFVIVWTLAVIWAK